MTLPEKTAGNTKSVTGPLQGDLVERVVWFCLKLIAFWVLVIGAERTILWQLAWDGEVQKWSGQHRGIVLVAFAISALMYALYHAAKEPKV